MRRIDRLYILLGLAWVILGMIFGTWLGATEQMNFRNSHAHMNLLGFVTSVLFGLLHWAYPSLRASRAAMAQLIVYQLGVVILVAGKVLVDNGTVSVLLPIGSIVTTIGAAVMLVMFFKHEGLAKA